MKISLKAESSRKIFLILASILTLTMVMPLSLCADQNNSSLSGLVFNDTNENRKLDSSSENGLGNWTVYVDLNNNGKFDDETEPSNQTDSQGYYVIPNIPKGTYAAKEVIKDGWTQTTYYANRIKFNGTDEHKRDFGNHENKKASTASMFQDRLFDISYQGAIVCFLIGFILIVSGLWGCKAQDIIEQNLGRMGLILAGVILIILGAYLLSNMGKIAGIAAPGLTSQITFIPMWLMLLIFVLIFVILLAIGIYKSEQMEGGQMRRAIAGLLVFGFVTILMFALYGTEIDENNKEIISQYIQLVGIIIGFYFGAKITAEAGKLSSEYKPPTTKEALVEIGEPSQLASPKKGIKIPIKNKSEQTIRLININLDEPITFNEIKHWVPSGNRFIEKGIVDPVEIDLNEAEMAKTTKKYIIRVQLSEGAPVEKEVEPK